jgi:hypothetical protein
MEAEDRLRLDYEQTTQLLRTLTDIRFKLLAFVPTISGAAVGLLGRPRPSAELLAVGVLGLVATLGIFTYELRNTQLYDSMVHRASELERRLGLSSMLGAQEPGGFFSERPAHSVRLLGLLPPAAHDRGLALVYSAALAGWTYLAAWGGLGALGVPGARSTGGVVAVVAGVLVLVEVERVRRLGTDAALAD